MRIKAQVIEAAYQSGVSQRTGNSYELTEYLAQATDEQGHNHRITFSMFGDKMRQEAVHKGDWVELSLTLGIREYNGKRYNEVSSVYFVSKLNPDGTTTKEALMAQQAVKDQQTLAQMAAQRASQPAPAAQPVNDLPF